VTTEIRYYIIGSHKPPVEAVAARVEMSWPDVADDFSTALDVAPGVQVKFLSFGDYWHPPAGKVVSGALVAVRRYQDGEGR